MSDPKKQQKKVYTDPDYRPPEEQKLSDVVSGRMQAGPFPTPPRKGSELDDWNDPELFHSPEL